MGEYYRHSMGESQSNTLVCDAPTDGKEERERKREASGAEATLVNQPLRGKIFKQSSDHNHYFFLLHRVCQLTISSKFQVYK